MMNTRPLINPCFSEEVISVSAIVSLNGSHIINIDQSTQIHIPDMAVSFFLHANYLEQRVHFNTCSNILGLGLQSPRKSGLKHTYLGK